MMRISQNLSHTPKLVPQDEAATVTDIAEAKFILANINWNFSTPFSVGRSGIRLFDARRHHWYPATFIPEIPYTLIEVLTRPESVIYDPFSGIGTTLIQASLLGRTAYATENCEIAVRLVRSMITLFRATLDELRLAELEIQEISRGYNVRINYSRKLSETVVEIEALRPWFAEETFNELMYLAWQQQQGSSECTRAAATVAISATLKSVCGQDEGWGCIADNMLPKPRQLNKQKDAIEQFRRKSIGLLRDVIGTIQSVADATRHFLRRGLSEKVLVKADARACPSFPPAKVDFIVTSPPYPNMTDYATSQRLSYYWIGEDPMSDLPSEIGARRRRFSAFAVEQYREAMERIVEQLYFKLRRGGYACFVMPSFSADKTNNVIRRKVIQDCLSSLVNQGFVLEQELNRILPSRRRHHNQSWTSLERETIFIYRKMA